MNLAQYVDEIFAVNSEAHFERLALFAFQHQFNHNPVYQSYIHSLHIDSNQVKCLSDIPFLPIAFFKSHRVLSSSAPVQKVFRSSGTTQQDKSSHYVTDLTLYNKSIDKGFEYAFGEVSQYAFLCILPSYIERDDASLVYMSKHLISQSQYTCSGFYAHQDKQLYSVIVENEFKQIPTIIIGVTFALLEMIPALKNPLQSVKIIETGGMKGRGKEMIRDELHQMLIKATGLKQIYSEYGMTELLSQAYLKEDKHFVTPPWMKVRIRETQDPFAYYGYSRTGGINIIDLANIHSCCFIETQDLGMLYSPNTFDVTGRFDVSDLRGCNLMIT